MTTQASSLDKIDHIVVLMLENRSFDNLLGWLYETEAPKHIQREDELGGFHGLQTHLSNPLNNVDPQGIPFIEEIPVGKNGQEPKKRPSYGGASKPDPRPDYQLPNPDPGEGFKDTNFQLFEHYEVTNDYPPTPTNRGFVNNYAAAMLYGTYSFGDAPTDPRRIMMCYTPDQVPILSELARRFAVCDLWHCSVPSQTIPNRDFVHAATSLGRLDNGEHCGAKTIFNLISEAKREDLRWRVYSDNPLGAKDRKKDVRDGKHTQGGFGPDDESFSLTRLFMTQLQGEEFDDHFQTLETFYRDAADDRLPGYSFLEPRFHGDGQNDQHPSADVRPGEALIANVYNAIVQSPAWEKTLLVITYDEHGGCYDHVAPPSRADAPDHSAGQFGFNFKRFGVRVPAVLVSPYIAEGTVCRPYPRPAPFDQTPFDQTPFDHTSIIRTVCETFGLKEHLTQRDRYAPDLGCALTRKEPRRPDNPADNVPILDPPSCEGLPGQSRPSDLHVDIQRAASVLTGTPPDPDEHPFEFAKAEYYRRFHEGERHRRRKG